MKALIISFFIVFKCSQVMAMPKFTLNLEALINDLYRSDLNSHVKNFEYLYGQKVKAPIILANIYGANAVCNKYPNGVTLILIDKNFFDYNRDDYNKIEYTIFHQLGHCELNRIDEFSPNDYLMKNSIMARGEFNDVDLNDYAKYKAYYMRELFKKQGRFK